jgi:hypothetical protein
MLPTVDHPRRSPASIEPFFDPCRYRSRRFGSRCKPVLLSRRRAFPPPIFFGVDPSQGCMPRVCRIAHYICLSVSFLTLSVCLRMSAEWCCISPALSRRPLTVYRSVGSQSTGIRLRQVRLSLHPTNVVQLYTRLRRRRVEVSRDEVVMTHAAHTRRLLSVCRAVYLSVDTTSAVKICDVPG